MNQLSDMEYAIKCVQAATSRKQQWEVLGKILDGKPDIGTREQPKRDGIGLLHRRALFVTELSKRGVWK